MGTALLSTRPSLHLGYEQLLFEGIRTLDFKVSSELLIKHASDKSGILVFVGFSAKVVFYQVSLLAVLSKINQSDSLTKGQIAALSGDLSAQDKELFWHSLINNGILIPSE
jgi:hypothetical protein